MTYRQEDMPFCHSGIIPDIILNPHAFPSRMTIGHLIECIQSKAAAVQGTRDISLSFCNEHDDDDDDDKEQNAPPKDRQRVVHELMRDLKKAGFAPSGTERMCNPFTGEEFWATICIGPTFYQRLKHMAGDKCHSRARGKMDIGTRQPVEGRSRDGGLRTGEMERDAILAHGAAFFLKDRLLDNSDKFDVPVCRACGFIASHNAKRKHFTCVYCNARASDTRGTVVEEHYSADTVTMITMPYAFKLLLNELLCMGVRVAIKV